MKAKSQYQSVSDLLVQICKRRRNKSNALLSDVGIHGGQDILLYYLSLEDGQTVSALVEKMCIQHATISTMIDRMEAAGMIKKAKDASDKRISRVYMTDKGNIAYIEVVKIWRLMEANATNGLTKAELDALYEILPKILGNLS
jgi:DNA-binding MarR family transcriptional regulator